MLVIDTLWIIVKFGLLLICLFVIHFIYNFIYLPWKVRKHFLKYSNVYVSKNYNPGEGDMVTINQNIAEGKPKFHHYFQRALERSDYDLHLAQIGPLSLISMCSMEAHNEFEKLVPQKIDKGTFHGFPVEEILPGNFLLESSTEKVMCDLSNSNHIYLWRWACKHLSFFNLKYLRNKFKHLNEKQGECVKET